jgi:hypothetical protein
VDETRADLGDLRSWRGLLAAFDSTTRTRKEAAVLKWRGLLVDFATTRRHHDVADVLLTGAGSIFVCEAG